MPKYYWKQLYNGDQTRLVPIYSWAGKGLRWTSLEVCCVQNYYTCLTLI